MPWMLVGDSESMVSTSDLRWIAEALAGASMLCSKAKQLTHTVLNFTPAYQWEPANCFGDNLTKCGEVTSDGLLSHPGRVEIVPVTSYHRH